jgi:hypothetical protein
MIDRGKRFPWMEYLVFKDLASVWSKNIRQPEIAGVEIDTGFIAENAFISYRIRGNY